jgi:hypothetical protein
MDPLQKISFYERGIERREQYMEHAQVTVLGQVRKFGLCGGY